MSSDARVNCFSFNFIVGKHSLPYSSPHQCDKVFWFRIKMFKTNSKWFRKWHVQLARLLFFGLHAYRFSVCGLIFFAVRWCFIVYVLCMLCAYLLRAMECLEYMAQATHIEIQNKENPKTCWISRSRLCASYTFMLANGFSNKCWP